MTRTSLMRRGCSALALGIYLAATPVVVDFDAADGFKLAAPKAFAKDGRSGDDSDDRDDDSDGRDDRSGSGGGGRSGGGSSGNDDRDDDDDRSGSGGGGRSGGGSSGSGNDDRDDDDRDDDRRGRGGDDRDDDSSSRSSRSGAAGGESGGAVRVVKFERSANGVEVVYSNGIKEEIENGRFEQKNAAGRTVVQRPATSQDLARLDGNARNSGITAARGGTGGGALPSDSQARRIEVGQQSVEVDYNTGWKEEISRGRYQLKDPNNNTVVERTATQADVDRLLSLSAR